MDSGNLSADTDIYFIRQAASDIDQTIRRFRVSISVDGEFVLDQKPLNDIFFLVDNGRLNGIIENSGVDII